MHEQRNTWKNYVFTAKQTDTAAITSYLEKLFGSSEEVQDTYNKLCINTSAFEKEFIEKTHFDENSLRWVIEGLLRSDLVSDEKRKLLKDILNNKVVLEEVCDVLNMRMGCLEKWEWDRRGTLVEQRRQINGRYRFYNDEDLLQTILLRFIGVKWSVFLKRELKSFLNTSAGWKPSTQPIPHKDKIRRAHFVGYEQACFSVEKERDELFRGDIFLSQLQDQENEVSKTNQGTESSQYFVVPLPPTSSLKHSNTLNDRYAEDTRMIRAKLKQIHGKVLKKSRNTCSMCWRPRSS